ncbi:MAG: ABC transporter substrate-binding protein [Candidatus Bacteroides intestinipullorum]|uniref:ABC transporter substrate-binding protein n=1 Tax=Candidatus Bacteroides intestinipullorum TaxID=2838471 RepID=A0A9E2KER5_9BACE|nr:ABC transporter substrate-binding protein [Candidatus Bacteroides intestinipullorum]
MRYRYCLFIMLGWALFLVACGGRGKAVLASDGGDTLELRHAENLTVVQYPDYTVATLRNPWDTLRTLHTYVLVSRDKPLPGQLPQGTVVRTPLSRALVYSSVHCSLLGELGAADVIGGVCDLAYIHLPFIRRAHEAGKLADCGSGNNPDVERIIELHPDAILLSPYQDSNGYGRIEELGIPIVECADYLETSALGRAEWMRFYGLLFGVERQADSLFAAVEANYRRLKHRAQLSSTSLSVLSDTKYGPVWYVSGGRSPMGRLYADACGRYVFADEPTSGALALSFESVLDRAGDADVWLIKYNRDRNLTYADLRAEYAGYAEFKAFKQRNIYGCNAARVSFFEETPFRPDFLLADLIQIFHPDVKDLGGLRYFCKLEE